MATEQNSTHTATPGPWSVTRSKMATDGAFDYAIGADGAPVIAEAFGRDAKGGWPPSEANARLIAAAPDMLDALKETLAFAEAIEKQSGKGTGGRRGGHIFAKARAALSKATGAA